MRIGIDVGGTGIQVGLVNNDLQIISEASIPTRTDMDFEEQVRQIAACVLSVISSAGIDPDAVESVGVGIPGIASDSGEIIKCTNMGWHHVLFREVFNRYYNKPVFVDNDANVAALAESVAGVSAGTSSSVFITIGTGIGSGIIIDGKIWKGCHGIGGELGHVIFDLDGVPCSCGNHGCLERYCSATAIIVFPAPAGTMAASSGTVQLQQSSAWAVKRSRFIRIPCFSGWLTTIRQISMPRLFLMLPARRILSLLKSITGLSDTSHRRLPASST